jgi:hypothetical protein
MGTRVHKTQRMALTFVDFLDQYHKDGSEFLSHILWVTADETWVSFVKFETKEQSKQWMHTHSPNKLKMFKQTVSPCQIAEGSCFLGQESSTDGGIHIAGGHNNVRSVLRSTEKAT